MDDLLRSTMNDLPGYEVIAVHGEVFGLVVRARNVFSGLCQPGAPRETGATRRYRQLFDSDTAPRLPVMTTRGLR